MTPNLPDDILHLLCEELALQECFDTLFNCACASRALAVPALTHLYRSHHLAPVKGGGDDEGGSIGMKQVIVQRWAILWRSIIASSLDDTLFPYCRYIKALDLRDLMELLDDVHFKGKVVKYFFSGTLSKLNKTLNVTYPSGKKHTRLDNVAIIDAVGEVVTQCTPMLETISGQLVSDALVRWAPRLPRLQTLELFNGSPLEDELVHTSIKKHCPQFNFLSIFNWTAEDRDFKFSKFLSTIQPQSLRALETITNVGAGAETFLALSNHSKSLKDLKLCVAMDTFPHLSLLRSCTSLEALRIEGDKSWTNLEKTQNDVFLDMMDWLSHCSSLRKLSFTSFVSAAALVAPVLLKDTIKLRTLHIDSYLAKDCQLFHQALAHQRGTLHTLFLSADTEGMFRDDVDTLVDSLKQLTELRDLHLALVQEVLQDDHLISIITSLTKLQELNLTGLEIKDGVLEAVGNLKNIREVTFSGISKFTTDGLFEFIHCLSLPGNQGIRVIVEMADPDTLLTDEEVALVRNTLYEKVGGTFDYTPWQDPNISEFEGDSD
ncbi:hypothetical protein K504DRAFT_531531 [Pleomassaria siparia CBS 279.74]|uniref:RNI-like protein n=1 Tax=Pleomassaria siparia CBS 279.74 TaxID=1314801 RepID=A0A6G1KI21_9PLEO|nr:hypothetical protein K504DRAFT_531531 [Pleomassaria siparia CBS 279.74]